MSSAIHTSALDARRKGKSMDNIRFIPKMYTLHSDDAMGITVKDRLQTKVCQCDLFTILHVELDHERIRRDKRMMLGESGFVVATNSAGVITAVARAK
jgi:hypothetical protein